MSLSCLDIQEFIGRIRIQAILKSSLLSSTFCQAIFPIFNGPLQSANELYLELLNEVVKSYYAIVFSRNWCIMSHWSDHELWHCKTTFIEWFWINVYPSSFFNKNTIGRQIHNGLWSWLSLCNQSPFAYEQLNVLNGNFFWRFCDVFVETMPKANPWNCLVFRQWFDHEVNAITSFVRIEFRIQDWADLRIWTNPFSRSGCCEVSRLSVFCESWDLCWSATLPCNFAR